MKKITLIIASLIFLSNINAQTEDRVLEDFYFLKVKNALEIVLTQGEENKVVITGINPEDAEKIKTVVTNGELSIYSEGKIKSKDEIIIALTFKQLRGIEQSGASEINSVGAIKEDKFSIKGSGAIEANLNLEVNSLNIDFSGASDIKLKGSANDFTIKLSGASDLKAGEFLAKNIAVDVSGASDVKVNASESITGKASGASNINVQGNPAVRSIQSSVASSTSYNSIGNVSINLGNNNGGEISDDSVDVALGRRAVNVNDDTTRIRWGNTQLVIIDDSLHITRIPKKRRNHWVGVDLGVNGFMDANNSFDLTNPAHFNQTNPKKVTQFMELDYSKSFALSINFMEFFIPIKEHHFGFVTGMGTEWNNYELKHNVRLNPQGGANVYNNVDEFTQDYTWGEVDTVLNYSKNRFKTWFVNVPLLLELNTGNRKNKSFHISAGAIVGMSLQTKMKYKYNDNGDDKKVKDKDSFNTNPFRVSLTTRVGVGWFNVFATYSLTPLFESNRGPELYPFTVGVTLLGF
jgi:hypothetical protein